VARMRHGIDVVDAVPDLVEQILAMSMASPKQRLQLRRLGITHKRRHRAKAIAGCAAGRLVLRETGIRDPWLFRCGSRVPADESPQASGLGLVGARGAPDTAATPPPVQALRCGDQSELGDVDMLHEFLVVLSYY